MLKEKNAIVTGANRGIGNAIVEDFACNGANIFACARTETEGFKNWCNELEKKYQVEITPLFFDLNDEAAVKGAFQTIKSSGKKIDILANVAGCTFNANVQMTSIKKMEELFETNLFSQIRLTQYILKLMTRQKSGSIVFIASSAGLDDNAGRSAYNASKAGVISVARTLSKEVGGMGIRVNAIAPGLTDTDMARDFTPEDIFENEIQKTSLKRIGKPEEIAHVATFLGSDLSSFVTGQVWRVDGGMQ